MGELGIENTPGEVTETFDEGLKAYWRGDSGSVTTKMETVLELRPDHPYAREFIGDCRRTGRRALQTRARFIRRQKKFYYEPRTAIY